MAHAHVVIVDGSKRWCIQRQHDNTFKEHNLFEAKYQISLLSKAVYTFFFRQTEYFSLTDQFCERFGLLLLLLREGSEKSMKAKVVN